MPIYEFKCAQCGARFAEFYRQMYSSGEMLPPPCPECHSVQTRRLISSFAIQGPSGPDVAEATAERAQAERLASITPKEQIDKWRKGSG